MITEQPPEGPLSIYRDDSPPIYLIRNVSRLGLHLFHCEATRAMKSRKKVWGDVILLRNHASWLPTHGWAVEGWRIAASMTPPQTASTRGDWYRISIEDTYGYISKGHFDIRDHQKALETMKGMVTTIFDTHPYNQE